MEKLKSMIINHSSQVEIMRNIYNENIDSLATRPLPYREYDEQQSWWEANKVSLSGYLYEAIEQPGEIIGFLILRDRGGFYTPTFSLSKCEWGKGYGREIVYDYIKKANGPLAGSQLKSNAAICHLNKQAGWKVLATKNEGSELVELLIHPGLASGVEIDSLVYKSILGYHGI